MTRDGKIDRQTTPGMPPRAEGEEQSTKSLELIRGKLGEGDPVQDPALRGQGGPRPEYSGLRCDRAVWGMELKAKGGGRPEGPRQL